MASLVSKISRVAILSIYLFVSITSVASASVVSLYPSSGSNYPVDGYTTLNVGITPPPPFVANQWASLRGAASSNSNDATSYVRAGIHSLGFAAPQSLYDVFVRGVVLFGFDQTTIPASSTINSATLNLYEDSSTLNCTTITNAQENLRITDAPITSSSSLSNADYSLIGSGGATYSTDLDANSYTSSGYNSITLNSTFISYLQGLVGNTTSTIELGLRLAADADNSTPAAENCTALWQFQGADMSFPPYLEIDFTPPAGSPPNVVLSIALANSNKSIFLGLILLIVLFIIMLWTLRTKTL